MLRIERAGLPDLAGAYRTCLHTGDAGQDATGQYRDPDLLGHVYVGPYLAWRQGSQLVVVDDAGIAGYLLSTDDTLAFEAWAEANWWPQLRERYPRREDGSLDAELIGLIHVPTRTPEALAREYPAHLHIDLEDRVRGTGMGRRLMAQLIDELRERAVPAVHLGVDGANENAIGFYRHLGFEEIEARPWGLIMGLRLD